MLEISDIPVEGYELVRRGVDRDAGLHAIVAIHSTVMGPALGGMRLWPYGSEEEALTDVLRLARGMTYKAICAGLKLGGGKSVMIGRRRDKTEALLRSMGEFVDTFGGTYITAEDVNTKPADMIIVAQRTDHVTGVPGRSGNPSPFTAHGCFLALKATLEEIFGNAEVRGRTVAIEGCGSVGSIYGQKIADAGGKLILADIRPDAVEKLAAATGGTIVGPGEIVSVECDVFAPCAMGGSLNDESIPKLRCRAVVGCANNQLDERRHGVMLRERGILYAPDYVVNAGGLINVYQELGEADYDQTRAMRQLESIYSNMKRIFAISKEEGIPPYEAADRFAQGRIAEAQTSAKA